MLEKKLWLAPPELEKEKSLENRWFYHDPIYNLCLQMSYLNSSNSEAYGAVAIQNIEGKPNIIGLGWNIYMAGETNFKRQGYANHAEFQSAALAESIGYNLNDQNKETCIYVAGRFVKEDVLFFSPDNIAFTCINCTSNIPKYFENVSLAAPTTDKGWRYIPMQEAYYSSLFFKHQEFKREQFSNPVFSASNLNVDFNQEHINLLIEQVKWAGITIDKKIEIGLLKKYEELLNLKTEERRNLLENLIDKGYKTFRKGKQSSLYTNSSSRPKNPST